MSATCPACGVAVVPGYVRCPKCQAPLPKTKRVPTVAGGTAVPGRAPIVPLLVGGVLVVFGVVLFFVLRDDPKPADKPEPVVDTEDTSEASTPARTPVPALDDEADVERRPDPNATAAELERALDQRRLWSSVEVVGGSVEVRSGSCRDENMIPLVDAARAALRDAGLTRLRCLENSGAVVFERKL